MTENPSRMDAETNGALEHSHRLEILALYSAGIAHDIGSPLTVIQGYCDIIKRQTVPGSRAHMSVGPIMQAAKYINEMVKSVLAFNPNRKPTLEAVELNPLLADHEVFFRDLLLGRVELQLFLTDNLPCISGDRAFLMRMFSNLVINARGALKNVSAPKLGIATSFDDDEVEVTVSDNGCGMDEEMRSRILSGDSFTTKTGHTGLGLGVVRNVIAQCKGRLEITSVIGTGATFSIYLPVLRGIERA